MTKTRLDQLMTIRGLTRTRSEAESWIKLGKVTVDGKTITKPGHFTRGEAEVKLLAEERYVSRAGLKLASVAKALRIDFADTVVLDVGSSTGGFTDYALQHGAKKVYAVDVGTDQLHPSLRSDKRIELHEKTDIRNVKVDYGLKIIDYSDSAAKPKSIIHNLKSIPDIIVIDVSFISLRDILPHIAQNIAGPETAIIAMVKPQFEAERGQLGNSGVVKNDRMRRDILKNFELWVKGLFVIVDKADSEVAGATGNRERFYLLNKLK